MYCFDWFLYNWRLTWRIAWRVVGRIRGHAWAEPRRTDRYQRSQPRPPASPATQLTSRRSNIRSCLFRSFNVLPSGSHSIGFILCRGGTRVVFRAKSEWLKWRRYSANGKTLENGGVSRERKTVRGGVIVAGRTMLHTCFLTARQQVGRGDRLRGEREGDYHPPDNNPLIHYILKVGERASGHFKSAKASLPFLMR